MSDRYIDQVAGNDASNGLAPETAWQSLTKINGLNPGNGATIYLAAGSVWDYGDSWATYKLHTTFAANGCDSLRSTDSAAPVTIKPYYPRASQEKPIVRWYASIAEGDWTHETGIGENVWSIPWVGSESCNDFCVVWGANNTVGVTAVQQVAGQSYGSNGTNPLQMANVGDYTKANNKVYFYCSGNPTGTLGSVKIFGRYAVFASAWQGLHNVVIDGLQFELCKAVSLENASATPVRGFQFKGNTVKKAQIGYFNNANSSPVQECELTICNNELEDIPQPAIRLRTSTSGTNTGNTWSWEIYGNRIIRGNLSSGWGGALAYIQANGGTNHIARDNYGFDCRNGTGGNNIDGAMIYADVYTDGCIITRNIAEQCGMPFQQNNAKNCSIDGNVAIDCPYFCQTTGAQDAPTDNISCSVNHNTWLWTGRVQLSDVPIGPGIPSFNAIYAQWNDGGATHPFASYAFHNNLAIDLTGELAGVKLLGSYRSDYITSTSGGGNASLGLGSGALVTDRTGGGTTDVTGSMVDVIGSISDAISWLPDCESGNATLTNGSLVGAGDLVATPYGDYRGRAFTLPPSIGACERDPLALMRSMIF